MIYKSNSLKETYKLGEKIGGLITKTCVDDRLVITLTGGLGCGKTAFVSAIAHGLGVRGPVLSPSFTIVKEYACRRNFQLYHIDLYRLTDISELMSFDFYEYLNARQFIMAIEWADKFGRMDYLPELPNIHASISQDLSENENTRIFKFDFFNINKNIKNKLINEIEK